MNNETIDDVCNILMATAIFFGLILFGVMYNKTLSQNDAIISIQVLNKIQERDCDIRGGGYLSFEKSQACAIPYPSYKNIKY